MRYDQMSRHFSRAVAGPVVQSQRAGLGGSHQLLFERGFKTGLALVDGAQTGLVGVRKPRSLMLELGR